MNSKVVEGKKDRYIVYWFGKTDTSWSSIERFISWLAEFKPNYIKGDIQILSNQYYDVRVDYTEKRVERYERSTQEFFDKGAYPKNES